MSRTIGDAERRAVVHENVVRQAIETALESLDKAEGELILAGDPESIKAYQLIEVRYTNARLHLGRARDVLAP